MGMGEICSGAEAPLPENRLQRVDDALVLVSYAAHSVDLEASPHLADVLSAGGGDSGTTCQFPIEQVRRGELTAFPASFARRDLVPAADNVVAVEQPARAARQSNA